MYHQPEQQQPHPQPQLQISQQQLLSLPLTIRLKHPSWSIRKRTYDQIFYLLSSLQSLNQPMYISSQSYTVQSLLPLFQSLIHQKHTTVLLKGLQCIYMILKHDKKSSQKHCIKTLMDKGIQIFPLLTQNRKQVLQKFQIFSKCVKQMKDF